MGAQEEVSNGNHATITGVSPTEDRFGIAGRALIFDGEDVFVAIGNVLNNAKSFTWSVWVRTTQNEGDGHFYQSPVIIGTVQGSGSSEDALLVNR